MMIRRGALMRSNLDRIERDILRRELAATGNLLVDALALHRHFTLRYARRPAREALVELQECRRIMAHLVRDYIVSMARYRKAVKRSFAQPLSGRR
jgi:hypothetical protein